jgi:hypothetical protein
MVQMQAFTGNLLEFQPLGLAITVKLVGRTGLDRTQHTDPSLSHAVSGGNLQSDLFLVGSGRGQIHIRPAVLLGLSDRSLDQFGRQTLGVRFEILQENVAAPQVGIHPRQMSDQTKRSAKNQTVPTAENPYNVLLVLFDKGVHGILLENGG